MKNENVNYPQDFFVDPPTEKECFDTAYLRCRAYNNSCKNYYSDIESLRLPN